MNEALDPMYRMPVAFGPARGPRNLPANRRHLRFAKRTTTLTLSAATDPGRLPRMLPQGFALRGEPRPAASVLNQARHGYPSGLLRVPLITLPLSVPFLAGFVAAPTLALTMASAAMMNFLLSCAFAPCVNYAVTTVDPADRGLVSSIMLAASGLIATGLAPFIVGALSDWLTPTLGAEGLRYALASMIPTPLIATVFIWFTIKAARPVGARANSKENANA